MAQESKMPWYLGYPHGYRVSFQIEQGRRILSIVVVHAFCGGGDQAGNPNGQYNVTESEPYTTDPAVLHSVLDGVAAAIEGVRCAC